MLVNTTLYLRHQEKEIDVDLEISYTESYPGSLTDPPTPEEVILEAVWHKAELLAFDDPIFLEADDYDYLMTFVEAEKEEYEAKEHDHFMEELERGIQ